MRTRFFTVLFILLLPGQAIHFKIALRSNSEGIRDSIEKRKHRGYVYGLSDLRLCPAVIAQLLYILAGGSIRRFRHLCYIVEQPTFRGSQARFVQVPGRNCLYCSLFCSLNTQEVCMRVQSIWTAIEPRHPACNRLFCPAVQMPMGKMHCVAEFDYVM